MATGPGPLATRPRSTPTRPAVLYPSRPTTGDEEHPRCGPAARTVRSDIVAERPARVPGQSVTNQSATFQVGPAWVGLAKKLFSRGACRSTCLR